LPSSGGGARRIPEVGQKAAVLAGRYEGLNRLVGIGFAKRTAFANPLIGFVHECAAIAGLIDPGAFGFPVTANVKNIISVYTAFGPINAKSRPLVCSETRNATDDLAA
jgi:hypothetical protein